MSPGHDQAPLLVFYPPSQKERWQRHPAADFQRSSDLCHLPSVLRISLGYGHFIACFNHRFLTEFQHCAKLHKCDNSNRHAATDRTTLADAHLHSYGIAAMITDKRKEQFIICKNSMISVGYFMTAPRGSNPPKGRCRISPATIQKAISTN